MKTIISSDKDRFLLNYEGQDFSTEAKTFLKTRESAAEHLSQTNFPDRKDEEWKYTRVGSLLKKNFAPQTSINVKSVNEFKIPNWEGHTLVFVNGFFAPKLSNIIKDEDDSFVLTNLGEAKVKSVEILEPHYGLIAKYRENVFTALNTAYANDGLFLYLPKNTVLELPIHVIHVNEGDEISSQPRNFILAEKNSQANIVMSYHSADENESFTNGVTEIVAEPNSNIHIDKVQLENEASFHINREEILQDKDTTVTVNTITVGGKLTRNDLNFHSNGSNTNSNLNGLYLTAGDQHVDNHTKVFHMKPGCESNENYKGIVGGKSTAVFNGKVFVDKKAQQTNAFQANDNILMTDHATANSKPELEIYADDVKCSHGSTIGQFDDEAVFFLRSRGIGEAKAKEIMVKAFADEVLSSIKNELTHDWVEGYIAKHLTKTQHV